MNSITTKDNNYVVVMRGFYNNLVSSIFTVLVSIPCYAQSTMGDYDGDGTSDVSVGITYSNGTTAYATRFSNGATPKFWSWNLKADAYAPGKYFGNGITYPAIVVIENLSSPLKWSFKKPDGGDLTLQYGLPGDIITNHGPDFDGDGISEVYVVRDDRVDGQKSWYIASSKFKQIYQVAWGIEGDIVFAADMNGNGKAEMIAFRPSTYEWFSREYDNTTVAQVQWGLSGDIPLIPYDLNRDGKADYIISRVEGSSQFAYIRYSAGGFEKRALGQATSLPMTGQFESHRGFAWDQRDTGWFAYHKPNLSLVGFRFGIPENTVIRPDGSVVLPKDSGRVYANYSSTPILGDPSVPVTPGVCTSPKFPDGKGKALWKPFKHGGSSSGDATFLIPPTKDYALSTSVTIYGKNGDVVHKSKLRYHYGPGARSVWDMGVRNSVLNKSAPLTVRTIYSDGTCENRIVGNASNRYD